MHNSSMQEPLSQFMCDARSTTQRHNWHHMSHRTLYPVFNELARCQRIPLEDAVTTTASLEVDASTLNGNVHLCNKSLKVPSISHDNPCKNSYSQHQEKWLDSEAENTLANNFEDSLNITASDLEGADCDSDFELINSMYTIVNVPFSPLSHINNPIGESENQTTVQETLQTIKTSRFASIRNCKSIFEGQLQENIFFSTFDSWLEAR